MSVLSRGPPCGRPETPPTLLLQDSPYMPPPHPPRQLMGIGFYPIASKVAADPLNIAEKQKVHIRVVAWVHGLREVDQDHIPAPIEDIVLREVAMNTVVLEAELYIPQRGRK